ncbi:MAG: CHAT domain-containing tetratricopeptide repeat protein [Bacteroidota bacterium]
MKKRPICLLFLLGALLLLPLSRGVTAPIDSLAACQAFEVGEFYHQKKVYDSAAYHYRQAADAFMAAYQQEADTSLVSRYCQSMRKHAGMYIRQRKNRESLAIYDEVLALPHTILPAIHRQRRELWVNKGLMNRMLGDYQASMDSYQEAMRIAREELGPTHELMANLYIKMGVALNNFDKMDEAETYLVRAEDLLLEHYAPEHPDLNATYINLGVSNAKRGRLDKAIDYWNQALELTTRVHGENHGDIGRSLANIGLAYRNMGDFHRALEYQEKAIQILKEQLGPGHVVIAKAYHNLASVYISLNNKPKALLFLDLSVAEKLKIYGEVHPELGQSYNSLGLIYNAMGEHEKALMYFEKTREIGTQIFGPNHRMVSAAHGNKALVYQNKGDIDRALEETQIALEIGANFRDGDNEEYGKNMIFAGDFLSLKGNYEEGIRMIKKGIAHLEAYSSYRSLSVISGYQDLARTFLELDQLDSAYYFFAQADKLNQWDEKNPEQPNFSTGDQGLISEELHLNNLRLLARIHSHPSNTDPDRDEAILTVYQKAVAQIHLSRNRHSLEANQQLIQQKAQEIFEDGIGFLHQQYLKTQDESYLEMALGWMEKSKAAMLSKAIREADARKYANIPDDLLALERSLRINKSFYEKRMYLLKAGGEAPTSQEWLFVNRRVTHLNNQYDSLVTVLEQKYPQYYQLKYNDQPLTLQQARGLLEKDQALVEYFLGDSSLFICYLDQQQIRMVQVEDTDFIHDGVNQLRLAFRPIEARAAGEARNVSESNAFSEVAYDLYQKLLQPFEETTLPSKLLIIPDGVLGFLPFDVLISEVPEAENRWKALAFLAQNHQISYAYSLANLGLLKGASSHNPKFPLLAIAPSFEDQYLAASDGDPTRSELGPLKYNLEEAQLIHQLLGGKVLLKDEATEENFYQFAPQSQIIHIASHARVNDADSRYSRIFFQPEVDSLHDGTLEVIELFNTPLEAELVVLSACETGLGEVWQGEGIISLARGMAYAGARSTITTLWQVNDRATAEIMERMYHHLNQGLPKDEALFLAKKEYLDQSDNLSAHPLFWAGFIPIGNMAPIQQPTNWLMWIGLVVLLGLGLLILRNRR